MEKHPPLPMTPFDILVTSSELQMMKLLLPYIPDFYQRFLAFFIKFSELQNTIRYFNPSGRGHSKDSFRKETSSPIDILEDLRPYIGKDAETLDSLLSAMNIMNMMQNMDMPDFSQMGDLSGMMDMMNMFTGNPDDDDYQDTENNTKKGSEEYERMDESSSNENH